MSTNTKKALSFILVICISLSLGIIINKVWNYIEIKTHPIYYDDIISKYSEEYGIPKHIIYSVINVESSFKPNARSSADALGLMQMIPKTFDWITGDEHLDEHLPFDSLKDPETSIKYGTYYLAYLYRKFDYNWDTTFVAYNAGEGRVSNWLSDSKYSDGEGNLIKIPEQEARSYVKKVNDNIKLYIKLYPELV